MNTYEYRDLAVIKDALESKRDTMRTATAKSVYQHVLDKILEDLHEFDSSHSRFTTERIGAKPSERGF